jgi:hypothetical protein
MGWIGVDFDGTLALHPDPERPWPACGRPVQKMVDRVKAWLAEGEEVRIVTARVCRDNVSRTFHRKQIEEWCRDQFGRELTVTSEKDFEMKELWDDRAKQVVSNTGELVEELAAKYKGYYDDYYK